MFDIGDIINLNSIAILCFPNFLCVSTICALSKTIKSLFFFNINNNINNDNNITIADIKSVNITQVGRNLISNLTCSHFNGLDLLTKGDLITILCKIINSNVIVEDIDTNVRIIKSIGDTIIEIVSVFFKTLDLTKIIKECSSNKISVIDNNVQVEIDKLLSISNLCQYSEQLNSLSLLSHKNKLTCIGAEGLSSQRAGVNIRNIHQWFFGKVCPIESPEGQTIGLIAALSLYANIDINGYITTAYYKVRQGCISNDVIYLNSYEEGRHCVFLLDNNYFYNNKLCLKKNKFKITKKEHATLCIISPMQIFSCAVNLIPFLNHNDPTRALMAASMQKQAIPLSVSQFPLVGTGLEYCITKNVHYNIVAQRTSIVINVDTTRIIVYEVIQNRYKVYLLPKFSKSNQGTCLKLRPIVYPYQIICQNEVLAECQSSNNGEISLGANLLVTFMCWDGFNYEDSILISSTIVDNGILDSFHIMDLEVKVVKTLFGIEKITNELKLISLKYYKYLPKNGIVTIGTLVHEGDVLVGKLSPAIDNFTNKIDKDNNGNKFKVCMVDSSLRVPEGINSASVLEVLRETQILEDDGSYRAYILGCNVMTKNYIRRCNILLKRNGIINLKYSFESILSFSLNKIIKNAFSLAYRCYILHLQKLQHSLFKGFNARLTNGKCFDEKVLEVIKVKLLIRKSIRVGDKISGRHGNKGVISKIVPREDMPFMADGTPVDIVLNPLGVPSRMNIGQILETNFGFISYRFGIEFKYILEMYECHKDKELVLKMATSKLSEFYPNIQFCSTDVVIRVLQELCMGIKISCPLFDFSSNKLIKKLNKRLSFSNHNDQYQLYDGRTGLLFDRKSTVGIMYIFKLDHLVDDKMYARSIGPYSIITQQPLKGRVNDGGQRLGEMEIWALQSYGAAFSIKEALTAKCDDIISRETLNESLSHGAPLLIVTWGEGLLLLLRELFAMCVNVKFK